MCSLRGWGVVSTVRAIRGSLYIFVITLLLNSVTSGQDEPKPGFNIFKPEQDVQIGRQAAAEMEKQLKIVDDPEVLILVEDLGKELSTNASQYAFPFEFKAIKEKAINAFALPGGPIYVNSGTIQAVRTQGELAGVIAHEISHVILRHGTNQASKAIVLQSFANLGGGVLPDSAVSSVIQAAGGIGLNSLFLKYSRSAETQADVMGSHLMAKAGYDPNDLASFFDVLNAETKGSRQPQFFSSHPNPDNRSKRIRDEIRRLKISPDPKKDNSKIERAKEILKIYDN